MNEQTKELSHSELEQRIDVSVVDGTLILIFKKPTMWISMNKIEAQILINLITQRLSKLK